MTKLKNSKNETYDLLIRGAGGYFTLGSMSNEAADYWRRQQTEDLMLHLQWPEDDDVGPKEGGYRLADYRESADIAQVVGFDDIEKIKVYFGDEELETPDEGISVRKSKLHPNNFEGSALFTRTKDWGHLSYRIETAGGFDFKKLLLKKMVLGYCDVIAEVVYDNEVLEPADFFEYPGKVEATIIS
jgi:hypothetical protein